MKSKITKAASAFGNSGGGCFLVGITDEGIPDGGIKPKVSKQSLGDWVDAVLRLVSPTVKYTIKLYDTSVIPGGVIAGKVVLAISFAESALAPHMADDNKYYIRVGAHSSPASSFIVEALWARRSKSKPMLSHVVRQKPGNLHVVQIGVIAINSTPAINVEFTIEPLLGILGGLVKHFPIRIPVVDQNNPFYLDCTLFNRIDTGLPSDDAVCLIYSDTTGESYSFRSKHALKSALGPTIIGTDSLDKIANAIIGLSK